MWNDSRSKYCLPTENKTVLGSQTLRCFIKISCGYKLSFKRMPWISFEPSKRAATKTVATFLSLFDSTVKWHKGIGFKVFAIGKSNYSDETCFKQVNVYARLKAWNKFSFWLIIEYNIKILLC